MSAISKTTKVDKKQLTTTKTKKRTLSPEDNTATTSAITPGNRLLNGKKRKTEKMSAKDIDELKRLLATSTCSIENKIAVSQTAVETKVNDLASKFKEDINSIKESVAGLSSKVGEEIVGIKRNLIEQSERLDNTEDDIQRLKLSQDLRLVGFVCKQNENLLDLFYQIANAVDFAIDERSGAPTLERPQFKNKTTGQFMPSSTILVHFPICRQKQMFYSCYLNKMPLNPELFGLPKEQRVMISENLTIKNAKIFKRALLLRKDKKIAQTFTEDGIVFIRFNKGKTEPTHIIRNITALEILVEQHQHHNMADDSASNNHTDNSKGACSSSNNNNNTINNSANNTTNSSATQMSADDN